MKVEADLSLTVLGCRGSMPKEGKQFEKYGGATSCYKVTAGNEEIFFDAGTGISDAAVANNTVSILISHLHFDHLIGLPFFSAFSDKSKTINIYGKKSLKTAIDRLISVPLWVLKLEDYPANVNFQTIEKSLQIGEVAITTMEGSHPGGCTIYRLTYRNKSIVYATDFEHIPENICKELIKFANNSDLLLYDAQYTAEEYDKFQNYGHSTPEVGLQIAKSANVKQLVLIHHAPWRTDNELDKLQSDLHVTFAKIGDKFNL